MTMIEYRKNRAEAHRKHREVRDALEKFSKRSKFIEFKGYNTFYGFCRIDLRVVGDGKVATELFEYLRSICPVVELSRGADKYPSDWYRTYENDAFDDEDDYKVEFEICVSRY